MVTVGGWYGGGSGDPLPLELLWTSTSSTLVFLKCFKTKCGMPFFLISYKRWYSRIVQESTNTLPTITHARIS